MHVSGPGWPGGGCAAGQWFEIGQAGLTCSLEGR